MPARNRAVTSRISDAVARYHARPLADDPPKKRRAKRSGVPAGWHPGPDYPDRDPVQPPIPVGARVRLTGRFLRNTGQIAGGEGGRVWKTVACDCDLCADGSRFVAVDEPAFRFEDETGPARPRHIAQANLENLDRLAAQTERAHKKLLERQRPWEKLYARADREIARAARKHGKDSREYRRAMERRAFLFEMRARSDRRLDYEEVFGHDSDPERYMHIISPIDQARIITKGEMSELGDIEDAIKE